MLEDFKKFAAAGNVVDLAVGVIVGGMFGKIVTAFVDDMINPILGLAGKADFTNLYIPLSSKIVSTAGGQLPALADARKGLAMFRKVEVPLLGIVENMSYFLCPDNGKRYDIFGHGGARDEATRQKVPFLGEIPLDMGIRETSDSGQPVVVSQPDGAHAKAYVEIARKVWDQVAARLDDSGRQGPRIIVQ